jgi:hypothetical protein
VTSNGNAGACHATPLEIPVELAALSAITEGRASNMFLFADQAAGVATNPLDLEWTSGGKREAVRLTD